MKPRTIRIPVDVFIVTAMCKKCGTELAATGATFCDHSKLSYPPTYEHQCPKCGVMHWCDKTYPCTEYERRGTV